jgi:uncharacterized membrane protein YidH (DUF202 family)
MGLQDRAIQIAIGVILLVALVLPFIDLARVTNVTATPTVLGLPSIAWNAIMLVIVVIFVFGLIKYKK